MILNNMDTNLTTEKFFEYFDTKTFNPLNHQTLQQIINDWGVSSKSLRIWLDTFYKDKQLEKLYTNPYGLKPEIFLHYRKPNLYFGEVAIKRLELAIKVKVTTIYKNEDINDEDKLPWLELESLRLWVLINSQATDLSFEGFKSLMFNAYFAVINNWDEEVDKLIKLQDDYNATKYIKIRYHYKKEDFSNITPDMTLTQAYNDWCKYEFPHFLDYYKNEETRKFKVYCAEHSITGEYKNEKWNKLQAELNRLKLPKPTKAAFLKLLKRYDIEYKQKKH